MIGADGHAMLALSGAIVLLSLGGSLLLALGMVLRTAWRTPASVPPAGHILVLGMRLAPDGTIGRHFRTRLQRAEAVWHGAPASEIVILGGQTTQGVPTEAAAGAAWLQARGLPADRLHLEDRSRHTLESLRYYRAQFPAEGKPAILITSRFHLARAAMLADGLRISHMLCAAETARGAILADLPRCLFEAVLIHWYVTGRSFAQLTGNRPMTAQIT